MAPLPLLVHMVALAQLALMVCAILLVPVVLLLVVLAPIEEILVPTILPTVLEVLTSLQVHFPCLVVLTPIRLLAARPCWFCKFCRCSWPRWSCRSSW